MAKKKDKRFDRAHAKSKLPKEFTRTRLRALLSIDKWGGGGSGLYPAVRWLSKRGYITYGPFPRSYPGGSTSHSYRINESGIQVLALLRAPYAVSFVPGMPMRKLTQYEELSRCGGVMHSIAGTLRLNENGAVFFFPADDYDIINSILGEE
jgi:hypothetical protein